MRVKRGPTTGPWSHPNLTASSLASSHNLPEDHGINFFRFLRFLLYLRDQIHGGGCAASITATLDSRIPIAIERGETIIDTCNHLALLGHTIATAPEEQ